MTAFSQLLRPLPAARRAYSVFSKPGGGRYFNSAKPPKVSPGTSKGKVDVSNPPGDVVSAKDQSQSQQHGAHMVAEGLALPIRPTSVTPIHPVFKSQDLKLHQFFSLHRPLLLASQPASALFEPSPPPFNTSRTADTSSVDALAELPEVSAEDDADTARQLARAMVVNRIGASMLWEQTLQRLGVDVAKGREEEVKLAEAEFQVYLDSTKRKRRKKMRTHKLKKRRRVRWFRDSVCEFLAN
ncbi:hypothetical protein DAEQUDRAFT_123006 [Daedalea quercina L-15889]|uniref:Uncharacterized protein n=1 Tax=Daedalea quercina L-15889 TaxID=1314783 RepID=A0A165RXJ7_9APHY|nr:hypothetical protein DAEQUDRAFT_123006 [Daedalea quercina L-15889]